MTKKQPVIMIISGSPREQAVTKGLAQTFRQILDGNAKVLYIDLQETVLPLFNGNDNQKEHPDVRRLFAYAEQAEGFVITTPEYHAGMSGVLKNALDYLSKRQFHHKPAAISVVAGGGKGGINALNDLRTVLRGLNAFVLPEQIAADKQLFNERQKIIDENLMNRISLLTDELLRSVLLWNELREQED